MGKVSNPPEVNHVNNCPLCFARGFICEFCRSEDIIFPFQPVSEVIIMIRKTNVSFELSLYSFNHFIKLMVTIFNKFQVHQCKICFACYHGKCFLELQKTKGVIGNPCIKCQRIEKRQAKHAEVPDIFPEEEK